MIYTDKIKLIHKYLSGELNSVERQDFVSWIDEDVENETLFDQVSTIWEHAATPPVVEFNAMAAFDKHIQTIKQDNQRNNIRVVKKETRIFSMTWMRIAAASLVIILVSIFVLNNNNDILKTENNSGLFTLTDGTKVWLDKNSKIDVGNFTASTRILALEGKAYFEVAENKEAPFTIQTNDFVVKVLGTKFIVDDNKDAVVVREGKVSINNKKEEIILIKDQKVEVQSELPLTVEDVTFDTNILWFNEDLIFNNTPFDKVIEDISENYNIKFILPAKKDWSTCPFTSGSLKGNSIQQILTTLKLTYDMEYVVMNDNNIKISRVKCK